MANFAFRIFGAAMFAEPPVAEVKEVIGLIQGSGEAERGPWRRPELVRPAPASIIACALFRVAHQVLE